MSSTFKTLKLSYGQVTIHKGYLFYFFIIIRFKLKGSNILIKIK